MEIPFSVDVARDAAGAFAGTVTLPVERIKGLPLLKVTVEGTSVTLYARADQPLTGIVSADGTTITGEYFAGGNTAPFTMTRTGDARIEPQPTSAAIGKELEGVWDGILAANGLDVHVRMTLANRAAGGAVGDLVNLDQGGLRLPLAIAHNGTSVTLTITAVPSSFTGTLNAATGELAGTFTQGALSVPVTFRRAAARDGRQ